MLAVGSGHVKAREVVSSEANARSSSDRILLARALHLLISDARDFNLFGTSKR